MTTQSMIIAGLGAVIGLWVVITYNRFVSLKRKKEEGWSGVLVQLKRRRDLVPNLVNTIKGYAAHEVAVFADVTNIRAASQNTAPDKVAESEREFSGFLGRLMAISEDYPDLKASQNFNELQKSLGDIENEIQMARRYFNGTVREYNILVESFPSLIIAKVFSYQASPFFELESSAEAALPEVSF